LSLHRTLFARQNYLIAINDEVQEEVSGIYQLTACTVDPYTMGAIARDAGLTPDEFRRLL
jgi:hypothetical protein